MNDAKAREIDVQYLLEKVEKVTKEKKLDLSSDEDLSIGIMNLISIEEHLHFTAQKTGKQDYYELLDEVRHMRTELLGMIIKEYEGEVWCISKHLLASSMRLMEVGTKQLRKGNKEEAKDLFDKSYQLYSLFWALNLGMADPNKFLVHKESIGYAAGKSARADYSVPKKREKQGMLSRLGDVMKRAINCCKEW